MDNQKVLQKVTKEIELACSQEELQIVKVAYLGKKGIITDLLKSLKDLSLEEKKSKGAEINTLREKVSLLFDNRLNDIKTSKTYFGSFNII